MTRRTDRRRTDFSTKSFDAAELVRRLLLIIAQKDSRHFAICIGNERFNEQLRNGLGA